ALCDIQVRGRSAVGESVPAKAAPNSNNSSNKPEPTPFEDNVFVICATAGPRTNIDDTGERIAAIEGRTRTAHKFNTIGIDSCHVFKECSGVPLDTCSVTKAHPSNQHRCVLRPQAACLDADRTSRTFQLFDAYAGQIAYRLRDREFVSKGDLIRIHNIDGF